MTEKDPEILARLDISPGRRWFAIGVLSVLAVLLLMLAVQSDATLPGKLVFVVIAALSAFAATRLYNATQRGLILTDAALMDTSGQIIAPLDQVTGVERGTFAFKPSGGFMIKLKDRAQRGWAPGLWWRFGRVVGVGGVTSAGQAKAMADILLLKLAGQ